MMKYLFIVVLGVVLLTACSENDNDAQEQESNEPGGNEDAEELETTYNEEAEPDDEETGDNEEEILEVNPITFQQELWHSGEEETYEVNGKVGPMVREGDLAILPVTLDSDSDLTVSFKDLFNQELGTGEGIAARQGYDIQVIDSREMTVSQPAVLLMEDQLDTAVHTFLGEGGGNRQATFGEEHEPARFFGVFAAPEMDQVHVMFRRLGVVENIPVINREEAGTPTIEEVEDELTESELEEIDEDTEEVYGQAVPSIEEIIERELVSSAFEAFDGNLEKIDARVFPIESYRESVETSVSRIDEIEYATLMISSDVLFDYDSSDLLEEAEEELEAAIAELAGAEGGDLEIVGHTDDEGTEEYNQELSEDRAEAVREQLEELTDLESFDIAVRGESFRDPIADNKSEEGSAQNRRVELHFTPPTEEVEIETEAELPEALGEEAEHPDTIQSDDGEIEIESLRQIDNLLVGRIRVSSLEEVGADYTALTFGFGRPIGARGWHNDESVGYSQFTAYAPTLIHNSQRYYPLDYYLTPLEGSTAEDWVDEAESGMEYIVPLAERNMGVIGRLGEDGYYTATVIWPAVDAETVTVDLTVPRDFLDEATEFEIERTQPWRFTNVPVETENKLEEE
ncbi:OmpA family protein [Virgibacillus oceani]